MATHSLNMLEKYQERYDLAKFISPVKRRFAYFDIVDSEFLSSIRKLKKFNTYTITSEEGRPDLLSERIYGLGEIQFWWILMILNELRLPKDLKRGMIIKYPSRDDLEGIYLSLGNKPESPLNTLGDDDIVEIERLR